MNAAATSSNVKVVDETGQNQTGTRNVAKEPIDLVEFYVSYFVLVKKSKSIN